MTNNIC